MTTTKNNPRTFSLAVVDDDALFLTEIRECLRRLFDESHDTWTLETYPDAESFWLEYPRKRHDIVMLDVMLPGESGIQLARRIYATDKRTVIVFVTASADYACHGYGVNAVGYLVKPVDDQTIANLLRECRKRLAPTSGRHIALKTEIGLVAVPLSAVTHLESYYKKVLVHSDADILTCSGRLDEYLPRLGDRFLQVHKSFVVNMKRVRSVKYDSLLLDNDTIVPVSRSRNREVQERYFAIMTEDGDDA